MSDFASSLALVIFAAWVLHEVFKLMDRVGQGVRDWGQGRLLEAENEQRRLERR